MLFLVPLGLFAARLTLRDGTVVYGTLISGSSDNILIQDEYGADRGFDLERIRLIDFDAVSPNANARYERPDKNRECPGFVPIHLRVAPELLWRHSLRSSRRTSLGI